ncbi:hypothetical protein AAMO2058_000725300 [Amorphochlora amoebiformis]
MDRVSKRGVTCMAWNKDCSMIALCPNSSEIHIYQTNGGKFKKDWEKTPKYILGEHTEVVSSIDWCHATNALLTCSHDRNAYVWTFDEKKDKWIPSLVILRINRAATMCKWSPLGNKFAVASSAKVVPICHYEEKHKWWVATTIKKHKSTVLSVAWSPNNKFIVTGGTDYRCRIISAYQEALDPKDDPHDFGKIFPKQHEFGEVLAEFQVAKAWVHDVAWSPSGYRLAFLGHGSTIHFVQLGGTSPEVTSLRHSGLPYLAVEFISDKAVVASGFDQNPHVYVSAEPEGTEWKFEGKVDKEEKKVKKKKTKFSAAASMFENAATRGQKAAKKTAANTVHQNSIMEIYPFWDSNRKYAGTFETCGIDGVVTFWDLSKAGFKNLKE